MSSLGRVLAAAQREKAAYNHGEEHPLGSFLALMGVYGTAVTTAGAVLRARRTPLPDRMAGEDLALYAVATFRLSRLIAKDSVTSSLRAPFTTFAGTSGESELMEEVRGTGPRKAIGELVTCPFCLGQWVATSFTVGHLLAPRATRLVAAAISIKAAADVLQLGYDALQTAVIGDDDSGEDSGDDDEQGPQPVG